MRFVRLLIIFVILSGLNFSVLSCSLLSDGNNLPEVRAATINVVTHYVSALNEGNVTEAEYLIAWSVYIQHRGDESERLIFRNQAPSLRANPKTGYGPLSNLAVISSKVDGDKGVVTLRKLTSPNGSGRTEIDTTYPSFEVRVQWMGQGWAVSGDTIFGSNGYLAAVKKRH